MHGKVWMFSNLIDDEDIEFMQHEFISYKQAMDYYELGYKPRIYVQIGLSERGKASDSIMG